jgi:hypothetical protein
MYDANSTLFTNKTRTINDIVRSLIRDSKSHVMSKEVKKEKGVKKSTGKSDIMFDDFKEVLFTETPQYGEINVIRSAKHDVYTIAVNKLASSANDDKLGLMSDGISTKAIGYFSIKITKV